MYLLIQFLIWIPDLDSIDINLNNVLECVFVGLVFSYSTRKYFPNARFLLTIYHSVADPDPKDPFVFGPSGIVSQRYGSGSFHHKAKISLKTFISKLYDFKLDPDLEGPTLFLVGFDPDPAEKFAHKKKKLQK